MDYSTEYKGRRCKVHFFENAVNRSSKLCHVGDLLGRMLQHPSDDVRRRLAKHIGENVIQFDVRHGKTVLCAFFFTDNEIGKFPTLANQIPKLANIRGRYKAPRNKIVLENIRDPFCVLFVGFLALDCLNVFGMSKNDITSLFQNVVNGNPILSRGFHTNVLAVICGKPLGAKAKIFCECRKAFAFVGGNALLVGGSNTGIDEGFVDVYSTTDRINDFKHKHIPSKSI